MVKKEAGIGYESRPATKAGRGSDVPGVEATESVPGDWR